jgi:hypothetical protein
MTTKFKLGVAKVSRFRKQTLNDIGISWKQSLNYVVPSTTPAPLASSAIAAPKGTRKVGLPAAGTARLEMDCPTFPASDLRSKGCSYPGWGHLLQRCRASRRKSHTYLVAPLAWAELFGHATESDCACTVVYPAHHPSLVGVHRMNCHEAPSGHAAPSLLRRLPCELLRSNPSLDQQITLSQACDLAHRHLIAGLSLAAGG